MIYRDLFSRFVTPAFVLFALTKMSNISQCVSLCFSAWYKDWQSSGFCICRACVRSVDDSLQRGFKIFHLGRSTFRRDRNLAELCTYGPMQDSMFKQLYDGDIWRYLARGFHYPKCVVMLSIIARVIKSRTRLDNSTTELPACNKILLGKKRKKTHKN